MSGPTGVRIPGRKTVEAEYAEAVLESVNWSLSGALDQLTDRTIKLVASGSRMREVIRKSCPVVREIYAAHKEHEKSEAKKRSAVEFRKLYEEILPGA